MLLQGCEAEEQTPLPYNSFPHASCFGTRMRPWDPAPHWDAALLGPRQGSDLCWGPEFLKGWLHKEKSIHFPSRNNATSEEHTRSRTLPARISIPAQLGYGRGQGSGSSLRNWPARLAFRSSVSTTPL